MIPAEMLENAAMQALKDATSTFTDIHSAVRSVVGEESMAFTSDVENVEQLREQRQVLEDQIDFYVNNMSLLGKENLHKKTAPLRQQMLDISRRIEAAANVSDRARVDVDEIVKVVEANCTSILSSLDGLDRSQKRHLLHAMVKRVEVDLETRETVMEVQMPSWAIRPESGANVICSENISYRTGVFAANNSLSIPIATYSCVAQRLNKKFCMSCSRAKNVESTTVSTLAA